MTRAAEVVSAARTTGRVIAVAESCTGGLLAAAITSVAGASTVFDCGFVTYSNDAKRDLLGVRAETLERHGAVSEGVAVEMAQGVLTRSRADAAVAVTGIAGPGGSEHKPEGRVCFAIAGARVTRSVTVEFGPIGRDRVRAASTDYALDLLLDEVARPEP